MRKELANQKANYEEQIQNLNTQLLDGNRRIFNLNEELRLLQNDLVGIQWNLNEKDETVTALKKSKETIELECKNQILM